MFIRRIVIAADASTSARHAAARAVSLAGRWGAELTLVHVYEAVPDESPSILTATLVDEKNRLASVQAMNALTKAIGEPELRTVVQAGRDIPGTVCEVAAREGADLVVVGTIGRTGVARFFMGSVAENVVRRASCPVWVERTPGPLVRDVERLVVCTDLSAMSEAGVALASELASSLGVAIELVHALEAPYRALSPETQRELTKERKVQLTRLAAKYFEGMAPRVTIVEGANVVDAIIGHVARTSTELLVLATHGRTGLSRVFMGSIAERVTRFAPCSVLVARSSVPAP